MTTSTRARRIRQLTGAVALAAALAATACEPAPATPPTPPTTTTTTVAGPTPTAPVLATAKCASGSSITVAATIVDQVQGLLDAARADGVALCGGGYRDSAGQIAARKRNCGTTYYDIYQKPSSQCSPPTAIPGTSMHEKGLAIDFTNCQTRTSSCYVWLNANAKAFGLVNLPSEPWHWSTNGR